MSSMTAWPWRRRALRRRTWKRLVLRLAASRSSSSASHSACASSAAWAWFCNSTKASAMPSSFKALSWSSVGCVSIVFSSMEVAGAADVRMRNCRPVRGGRGPFGIEVVFEDRMDGAEGARPDRERALAGRLNALPAIALGQPDDADRSAKALLWMRALAHDDLDQRRRIAADLAGLPSDPLRRPIGVAAMARRHVLAHRGVAPVGRRSQMRRDTLAAMEDFYGARRDAHPHALAQ